MPDRSHDEDVAARARKAQGNEEEVAERVRKAQGGDRRDSQADGVADEAAGKVDKSGRKDQSEDR